MNERLFLEAELPFFMLDTQYYPTTTQGNFHILVHFKEMFIHIGDSIMIVRELFNKYRSSLNEIYFSPNSSTERFSFE